MLAREPIIPRIDRPFKVGSSPPPFTKSYQVFGGLSVRIPANVSECDKKLRWYVSEVIAFLGLSCLIVLSSHSWFLFLIKCVTAHDMVVYFFNFLVLVVYFGSDQYCFHTGRRTGCSVQGTSCLCAAEYQSHQGIFQFTKLWRLVLWVLWSCWACSWNSYAELTDWKSSSKKATPTRGWR